MVYKVTTTQYFQEDPAKIGNFHTRVRDLWSDYVWRNRTHLVSALGNMPELTVSREWMRANATDFVNVFEEYYGTEIASRVRDILDEHVADMIQLLDYLKKPPINFNINTDAFVVEMIDKIKNSFSNLFDLMASLNTAWNLIDFKNRLNDIVETWVSQINMRLIKNWNEDLTALNLCFEKARSVAHTFASGIVEQQPDKFAMT